MNNLSLEPSGEFKKLDEIPSYFQYHAERTLPRDKKMVEFQRALKARYLALELEQAVRKQLTRQRRELVDDGIGELPSIELELPGMWERADFEE